MGDVIIPNAPVKDVGIQEDCLRKTCLITSDDRESSHVP